MEDAVAQTSSDASRYPVPPDNDWLHTLYEEAWRQYNHEGNVVYTRSSVFLAIHAALLAILAAVASPLLSIGAPKESAGVTPLGEIVFGSLLTVLGLFSVFLAIVWRGVATSSRRYFTLRWATAYAVEVAVPNLENYGLAHLENQWRAHEGTSAFTPFPSYSGLSFLRLAPLTKIRGFRSLELVISAVLILSITIVAVGATLVVYGLLTYR